MPLLLSSEKIKTLHRITKKFNRSQRITTSNLGNLSSIDKIENEKQEGLSRDKPSGIWYGFGNTWIEFLYQSSKANNQIKWHENAGWCERYLKNVTHIYEMKLNYKCIYRINNSQHFHEFEEKYANKFKNRIHWINWKRVADDYSGIEIKFLRKIYNKINYNHWYDSWDCSSGCVWHKEAVKEIKLLHEFIPLWTVIKH